MNLIIKFKSLITKALKVFGNAEITGDLTVDTGTLYVDSADNRVGIITTNPLAKLHVVGDFRVDNGSTAGALNFGADVASTNRTSNKRKLAAIVSPDYANTRNIEWLASDSNSSLSNNIFIGGRVGGSNYGATNITLATTPNNSTTGGVAALTINSSQNVSISSDLTVGTNTLYVDSADSRVGIGTTDPSAKLHSIATTEQLRLGYDASNYMSTTVNSSGLVTLDAVGSSAGFEFSDPVIATAQPAIGALTDNHVTTKLLADYEAMINGNEFRQLYLITSQQTGAGSSAGTYNIVGIQASILNTLSGSSSCYIYDGFLSHSGFSGHTLRTNLLVDVFFHGVMLRVNANTDWVARINFGVGAPTRTPPAAGVAAATSRQWGVEFYYDGSNYVGRMYWYDTSMNYGTPFTIPTITAANWVSLVYSIRMRQTTAGLLEFYINSPTVALGGGRLSDTPTSSMQATWTNNFYAGRSINFEVANGTAAASTNTRIHANTMFARVKYES